MNAECGMRNSECETDGGLGTIRIPHSAFRIRSNVWLHRFAVLLAGLTLFLLVAGGMVTSTGSGLAVHDWPNTYGQNMFTFPFSKWVGGIFYEHGHRLVASTVGFLTIILAVWLQWKEPRRWLRRLGWIALLAVICQGVLGGLTVLFLLPTAISVFHACLAQAFFCIVIAIAVFTGPAWKRRAESTGIIKGAAIRRLSIALVAVVFVQLLLGALMRHTESGLAVPDFPLAYGRLLPNLDEASVEVYNQDRAFDYFLPAVTSGQIAIHLSHRLGALGVTTVLLFTAATVLRQPRDVLPALRRPATLAIVLLIVQIGLGAWTVWSGTAPWVATSHLAVGAALLGTSAVLALRAYGHTRVVREASSSPVSAVLTGAPA